MDHGANEIQAVQQVAFDTEQKGLEELTELQLLLVGGGVGEVIFG